MSNEISPPVQLAEQPVRIAEVLASLSLAADLALGLPPEHTMRACFIGMRVAEELGLSDEEQSTIYFAMLLMDAGCTAWTSQFAAAIEGDEIAARRELFFYSDPREFTEITRWLRRYVAAESRLPRRVARAAEFAARGRRFFEEGFQNTCEVAARFARRLGMPVDVENALLAVFERWDGSGMPRGVSGEQIPVAARVAHVATFIAAFHQQGGREAATLVARERRSKAFDPLAVDAFLSIARTRDFWETLEQRTLFDTVVAMQPASMRRELSSHRLTDVALFAADFADLKVVETAGHSRRVAAGAEQIARRMSLPEPDIATIHLAGLLHDLGVVAIPSFILRKPRESLNRAEWELYRLHPHHSERIIGRIPALRTVATIIGAHHERPDGRGYHRGSSGSDIPIGARIISVVEAFDEQTRGLVGTTPLDVNRAIDDLLRDAGGGFDPEVLAALVDVSGVDLPAGAQIQPTRDWPAGLTAREVEVLRLAARGLTRNQIAHSLLISEHTVRAHLEHIYDKIDVTTRAAATLFAVEHDLL